MAKKKIYAVRKGHKTGLFYTWDECKKAVHGYSGAEYKGFLTKEEAEAFLNIGAAKTATGKNSPTATTSMDSSTLTTSTSDRLVVYVDGSFDVNLQKYSFGCVILLEDGRIVERSGNGDEPELLAIRNVAGEMHGAMYAVQWALENGYSSVVLHYDYEGIEKWATGVWSAKNPHTRKYAAFMRQMQEKIEVIFQKVKAHSGDFYNEQVDKLAKKALVEGHGISDVDVLKL
nr:ribonuclease H family protein [uncultured Anaerobutyricum sp.]